MRKNVLVKACLLLALTYTSCQQDSGKNLFTLLSPKKTNIDFQNIIRESEDFNVLQYGYLYNGGGVAIGDINNDGLPDIFFSGNIVSSKLYLNQGDFKFKDITESAGVGAADAWNTGVTMADVNGDGYLDIYVCRSADTRPKSRQNLLFINNGDATFTEQAGSYGLADPGYSTQAAFFDYDKDGDLDMFLLNHSTQEYAGFGQITASLKNKGNIFNADKLYRNEGKIFVDYSPLAGIKSNVLGFGLGVAISDLNDDGWPDIYVSNDYNEQDYLYINNHDGTFSERLSDFMDHVSLFSMGSDIADINNDGYFDVMTLDMLPEDNYRQKLVSGPDNYDKYQLLVKSGFYNQTMRNMLQLNQGGAGFSEIGQLAGVSNTDWSWASLFADFDNDGFKDLFITNGYKRDYTNMDFLNFAVNEKVKQQGGAAQPATMEVIEQMPAILVPNYIYKNNGDLTFTDQTKPWGLDQASISNGAAYGDLDNDGDLDLVVSNINEKAFIYRNNSREQKGNHYLKVSLQGTGANTKGIGSKIEIQCGDQMYYQEMMPTRGFQSSVDYNLIFGLGQGTKVDQLKITWPNGSTQTLRDIVSDQSIVLDQQDADSVSSQPSAPRKTLFREVPERAGLDFIHKENDFIDFKREQLLPHKLSTQGPRMATGDINNDGKLDLFVGGAKGSSGKIFLQNNDGFKESKGFPLDSIYEDVDALFFDADNDKDLDLYVVSGGNDFELDDIGLQDRLYINEGEGNFSYRPGALPKMLISGSCITAGDLDGDQDLDLFIGGRVIPGSYPLAPRSYVLENDGQGNFSDITNSTNPALEYPGLVTDALWSDFDGDQKIDLIVVGEWMPVRVFRNTGTGLKEIITNTGLSNSQGWWNRIIADDFDGDGDPDYVIGNFGWNAQIKVNPDEPASLYVKDFDGNGTLDPILCYYVQGESYPAYSKDDLEKQIPGIKKKYLSYASFADQTITDIFSAEELKDTTVLKANNFSTSYLENLGNLQFELTALPAAAQLAPVYGLAVEDFDQDGNKDLVIGGNFLGNRVKFGRYDASKGLLLKGNGEGKFDPVEGRYSGLAIRGEVRDIVVIPNQSSKGFVVFARNDDQVVVYQIDP